jgi:tetratricopeptide (TPR) repeat protein
MPRKRLISTCVFFILFCLLQADPASAQKNITLRGELQADSTSLRLADYQVQTISQGDHMPSPERARVGSDGSFTLHGLTPGVSEIRVIDQRSEIVYDEYVTIQEGVSLVINLRAPEQARPASGTVSTRELAHPIPEKALKEYVRGRKASDDGNLEKTIEHFHKAVEIDPLFFQAWNDLGAAYCRQKNIAEAAAAFQKANEIAPENAMVQSNLKITRNYLQAQSRMQMQLQPKQP